MLLVTTYKYNNKKKDFFVDERYRKVNLWIKNLVSFKNIDYALVDQKNMINAQKLIICNKDMDLETLYVFTNLFQNSPFVIHLKDKQKYHKFIELLDLNYDISRLPIFIQKKYSVITFIKKSEEISVNKLIRDNYLSINVVNITETPKKYFGKEITVTFSPTIKPHDYFNFTEEVLLEKISSYL